MQVDVYYKLLQFFLQ